MVDMATPTLTLNDGSEIPQIGLGTWRLNGDEAYRTIRLAIELGYRHIDTATLYGNEDVIGRAVADAIAAGDTSRDELFITSKVWNSDQGAERTPHAFQQSLTLLGLDYLDLYLIHWPCPQQGLYNETFDAMARLQGLGQIQSIGVANFAPVHLEDLVQHTGIVPAVNQIELHPGFSQPDLRAVHLTLGVISTAWAPLGRGQVLEHPVIREIAADHGLGTGAVVLRWLLQLGCVVIPKSVHEERLRANLELSGFLLNEKEMQSISDVDHSEISGRMYEDPMVFPGENSSL